MPFRGHLKNAAITQLVECLAVNQDVTGSSPVGGVYYLAYKSNDRTTILGPVA